MVGQAYNNFAGTDATRFGMESLMQYIGTQVWIQTITLWTKNSFKSAGYIHPFAKLKVLIK